MKSIFTNIVNLFLITIVFIFILVVTGCNKCEPVDITDNETITDINGNTYETVKIGNQNWMKDNLKATHYNNGEAIANITDNSDWDNTTKGAYCYYNNDVSYGTDYGCLYNWYAVTDSRNLCPDGWHVPNDGDWSILLNFLGGNNLAGGKMKEKGYTHWADPNTGGSNESGFTGLPGSFRVNGGVFDTSIHTVGFWWSSTKDYSFSSVLGLTYNSSHASQNELSPSWGLSVRCVENSGHDFGSFTDTRDGKTYKTVEIGNQTWMAENLNYHSASGSWVYDDNNANADVYGRLYDWEMACNVCPEGWRLPDKNEWKTLVDFFGGDFAAGGALKETGTTHWKSPNEGATNVSGFSALPGGARFPNSYPNSDYYYLSSYANFWSSSTSQYDDEQGYYWMLDYDDTEAGGWTDDKTSAYSVRCMKNN